MNLEKWRNRLIVFEGWDGVGKSLQSKKLTDYLNENYIPAVATFQPGDRRYGPHAEILHDMCKGKEYDLSPLANLFAFLTDRAEHTAKVVKPHLERGYTVISDRWWYSTIAYQFYGKQLLDTYGIDEDTAYEINDAASMHLKVDLSILLVRDSKIAAEAANNEKDVFESETDTFKERVKNAYLKMELLGHFERVEIVEGDIDATFRRILGVDF